MTTEELKKQKEAEKAEKVARKARFILLAKHHENEAEYYYKQAQSCDVIELVSARSLGEFAGL